MQRTKGSARNDILITWMDDMRPSKRKRYAIDHRYKWLQDQCRYGYEHRITEKSLHGIEIAMLSFEKKPVYLACGHTDMRKSINGLSEIVQAGFELDPFSKAVFVFCNRRRDRLKILEWDGDGFWLYFKRLEKGRFRWPAVGDESTMKLTGEELGILLGGARVEQKLKRNEVTERRIV